MTSPIAQKFLSVHAPITLYIFLSGVGKTVIAVEMLNKMALGGYYIPFILNFSAQTSSGRTQVQYFSFVNVINSNTSNSYSIPRGSRLKKIMSIDQNVF